MVRKVTRRSTRSPSSKKASRKSRRAFDPKRLPYAQEAQTLSDIFTFVTETLPNFIEEEFQRLDVARNESELFRALASLPDATLRKAGLRREDLPRFVLSAFHLITIANSRKARGRAPGRSQRRTATRAA